MAKQKDNWIPWLIIGGLVLYVMNQQPKGGGDSSKPAGVTAVVRWTIPSIRAAYKQAFLDAAAKIETGEIKDQEQWTKFISDNAGGKNREALTTIPAPSLTKQKRCRRCYLRELTKVLTGPAEHLGRGGAVLTNSRSHT